MAAAGSWASSVSASPLRALTKSRARTTLRAQHQLSRPGLDTDLSLSMTSALAQVKLQDFGFSDRNGCYEFLGAPCLGSQPLTTPRDL